MAYAPTLEHQLDGSATGGEDCGVAVVVMAVDLATQGAARPTTEEVRRRMRVPSGATDTGDQERAVESFETAIETRGREPLRYQRMLGRPWSDAMGALADGRWLCLSLSYAVVNDLAPRLSGDKAFRGNHAVGALGLRSRAGVPQVRVFDPLADGRRPGIPDGPRWWDLAVVKAACASFAGPGRWTGGIVRASPRLAPRAQDSARSGASPEGEP